MRLSGIFCNSLRLFFFIPKDIIQKNMINVNQFTCNNYDHSQLQLIRKLEAFKKVDNLQPFSIRWGNEVNNASRRVILGRCRASLMMSFSRNQLVHVTNDWQRGEIISCSHMGVWDKFMFSTYQRVEIVFSIIEKQTLF